MAGWRRLVLSARSFDWRAESGAIPGPPHCRYSNCSVISASTLQLNGRAEAVAQPERVFHFQGLSANRQSLLSKHPRDGRESSVPLNAQLSERFAVKSPVKSAGGKRLPIYSEAFQHRISTK